MVIRYGYMIKDGMIYDTTNRSYKLKKEITEENIIYLMEPSYYRRIYLFEPLLHLYSIDNVFEILKMNSFLQSERKRESMLKKHKIHYISNYATIYHYPPSYLTQKRFYIYKMCQMLKKRIDD